MIEQTQTICFSIADNSANCCFIVNVVVGGPGSFILKVGQINIPFFLFFFLCHRRVVLSTSRTYPQKNSIDDDNDDDDNKFQKAFVFQGGKNR